MNKGYVLRRGLNLTTLGLLFKRYSRFYCPYCERHFPWRGFGKLVSKDHVESLFKRQKGLHQIYPLGLNITKPKPEQFKFRKYHAKPPAKLPSKTSNYAKMVKGGYKIRDQDGVGSCTGQCGATNKDQDEIVQGDWPGPFSADYLYYEERALYGDQDQDTGANMPDIGTVLMKGCATRKTHPDNNMYWKAPSVEAYAEAKKWKSAPTQTPLRFSELKEAIYRYGGVRFGVPIPQSFFESQWNGGWVPCKYDSIQGYHAMYAVDYDDDLAHDGEGGYFIVINSWGALYGDKGLVKIPYRWIQYYESKGQVDNWQQADYPEPQECVEETVEVLETCSDGVTWKKRRVCKLGKWTIEEQTCPTPSPPPSSLWLQLRASIDDGASWTEIYTWKAKMSKLLRKR